MEIEKMMARRAGTFVAFYAAAVWIGIRRKRRCRHDDWWNTMADVEHSHTQDMDP